MIKFALFVAMLVWCAVKFSSSLSFEDAKQISSDLNSEDLAGPQPKDFIQTADSKALQRLQVRLFTNDTHYHVSIQLPTNTTVPTWKYISRSDIFDADTLQTSLSVLVETKINFKKVNESMTTKDNSDEMDYSEDSEETSESD